MKKSKSAFNEKLKPNQAICPKCRTIFTCKGIVAVTKCNVCGYDKSKVGFELNKPNRGGRCLNQKTKN